MRRYTSVIAIATLLGADAAHADVTISADATANMTCSNGICAPAAADATLNVTDLENLLAAGNVQVTTTGTGVQADNIVVASKLSWRAVSSLGLDAYESITINVPVAAKGDTSVTLVTNDGGSGGTLSFGPTGKIEFHKLASALTINGSSYMLVDSVSSLAKAITANASGNYALATDYDASQDGTYHVPPISTQVKGAVQGLGNTISNLKVDFSKRKQIVGGVFQQVYFTGSIQSLRLANERVHISRNTEWGGLVGRNYGLLFNESVSGSFTSNNCQCGLAGLVDGNLGSIVNSWANVQIIDTLGYAAGLVTDNAGPLVGSRAEGLISAVQAAGLVMFNEDTIDQSYATTDVTGGVGSVLGGLVGEEEGMTTNSYATGAVSGGDSSSVGGLVGETTHQTYTSYSVGAVSGGASSLVGGFVGDDSKAIIQNSYWDTTTSGTGDGTGEGNVSGLTGLTSQQLQSDLPGGFDPSIWAQDTKINNGFPYLINNPPQN